MCTGSKGGVNTSAQEAELQRQNQLLIQQAEARRVEELRLAEERRLADESRFTELFNTQQAELQRQRDEARLWQAEQLRRAETEAQAQRTFQEQLAAEQRAREEAAAQREAQRQAQLAAEQKAERDAVALAAEQRAGRMRQYADGRTALLDQYTTSINDAYANFDDNFFQTFAQDFRANYAPELQRQYDDEKKNMIFGFTRAGTLDSSAAAKRFGDLERLRTEREARVAAASTDAANEYRTSIDDERRNALTAAFSSGFVGQEDLPDGVTDVSGELGRIGTSLSTLTGQLGARAKAPRQVSFGDLSAITGDLASGFNAPSRGYQPYGRFGGVQGNNTSGLGARAAYTVR